MFGANVTRGFLDHPVIALRCRARFFRPPCPPNHPRRTDPRAATGARQQGSSSTMPRRLISAATGVLLVLATLLFATLVVGGEPSPAAPTPHLHPVNPTISLLAP